MDEVLEFLKETKTYFLATVEGDQPHVRPFGTIHRYNGRLYIQTGRSKEVSHQIAVNPQVEICAWAGADWVRIKATLVDDESMEAQQSLLDDYPELQPMYKAGDGNNQVLYLKDATASFYSFGSEPPAAPRVVTF
ncbi:MAG: pyridoxamine 5'-phosphate oxidase family protein [Coriobacteriales bacterium]|nr:pyridoxamine 5'-phosphate oxidase family protein [Coriobacteriales bacterium]